MAKASAVADPIEDEEESLFSVPTTLDNDTYMVKCLGLSKKEWPTPNQFNPDKPNISIMWRFNFAKINDDGSMDVVRTDDNEDLELEFSTSTAISPKSKAFKWATAFLRHAPTKDEVIKLTSTLRGKKAMAVIGQKENGYPEIVEIYPAVGVK